jgi:hypothetical protein
MPSGNARSDGPIRRTPLPWRARRWSQTARRARLGVAALAVLAVCAGASGVVSTATATPALTVAPDAYDLTISPAGGNTFQLTIEFGSQYATVTSFQLVTGNPTSNWSTSACTPSGPTSDPGLNGDTTYFTNCDVTVKSGTSVTLCFDGSGDDGGYIAPAGAPADEGFAPFWVTPAYPYVAQEEAGPVDSGAAVSGCTPSKITAPKCVVPNVKGVTLVAAKQAIVAANCKVGKIKRVKDKHAIVTGIVASQHPRAGSKGPKVNLVVTKR